MAKQNNNKTYCRYVRREKITETDVQRMYEIFSQYYGNSDKPTFIRDFNKKTGAFLVRSKKDKRLVGFSTVALMDLDMKGRKVKGVFSGDTIIEREYWGGRALQFRFFLYLLGIVLRHPLTPVFWLLISKGYKTYLLLANNFFRFYPHPDGKYDDYKPMVQEYSERLFPGCYDAEREILDFGEQYQHLNDDVAGITPEMCDRFRNIAFFEERNPTWRRGTELPCIGRASFADIFPYIMRFLKKVVRRRQEELPVITARPIAQGDNTVRGMQ